VDAEDRRVTLSLNAFLLRPGVTPVTAPSEASASQLEFSVLTNGRLQPLAAEEFDLVGAANAGDIVVALSSRPTQPPAWQRFLWEELRLGPIVSNTRSIGAIVFCAVAEEFEDGERIRWVAWTFGTGSRALRRRAQDPRFGLLVVLNLLTEQADEDHADAGEAGRPTSRARGPRMRELRYRSPAPYVQQTGHRAARDIPLDGFRIDRSTDLVAAIGSTGAVAALATSTLLGGRALKFRTQIGSVEEFVDLAMTALAKSKLHRYREEFTWIDNITLVEDEETIRRLRTHVVEILATDPNPASVDAILPDDLLDVGEDRSISTIAFPHERGTAHGRRTLTVARIAEHVARIDDAAERERALDASLRFFDESDKPIDSASILECLSAEFQLDGAHYIAYDGDFYLVNGDYVQRVDCEIEQIPESTVTFPVYRGETEPVYNARVGKDHKTEFICMDRALIDIPGETTFEACDLVAETGALVHVKRKGKSSALSHLFLQAANSCEMLRRSAEARQRFNKLLAERAGSPELLTTVQAVLTAAEGRRDELEVVFAFLGDWRGRTIASLPLFSRISLVSEARRVRNLGYKVTVKTISQ
jgi:uncharacterized protein (TIGR04141 family)